MSIDYQKREYKDNLAIWRKCRDATEGQERIHLQGELYLSKLSGQTKSEYNSYVNRALYYNASQRTVDAMSGLLFRKPPQIEVPSNIDIYLENIDLQGNSLDSFVEKVADEVITVGRIGLLVDHTRASELEEGQERTQAQADAENLRPFIVKYKTEDIINWNFTVINNVRVLNLVVVKEVIEDFDDNYETIETIKYRVLKLDEFGHYYQEIYIEHEENSNRFFILEEIVYPTKQGQKLLKIPFYFISKSGLDSDIEKPPILDIVNVNLSHYKTSADIEHAAHYTALPTPVVKGHTLEDGASLKIGSAEAWVFSEPDADAFYLEYSGQGITALEKRLEKKENQMAALGARMLVNEKAAAEAAETHNIKRQGENSALASISQSISNGITKVLEELSYWSGSTQTDIIYKINKDFIPQSMDSQTLIALLQTWQSGGIAFSDFVKQLQKGEILHQERTPEQIKEELEIEGPNILVE